MMNHKRILVVDDEPSVTRNLKLNLESDGGYEVLGENHATNALTVARNFRPDLILLDVIMPGMDGGDVAARLRADPLFRDTPIIFLTAIVSNAETDGHEMSSGEETFLAKPVDIGELQKTVEQHLRNRFHKSVFDNR
jgi:two-component system OmpR family response regulator